MSGEMDITGQLGAENNIRPMDWVVNALIQTEGFF
jgi:hypothetical protein